MRAYWRPLPAWPYPPRTKRKGLFRSSWSRSLELLGEEVERVDGSDLMIGVVADDSQFRIDGSLKANAILKHPGAEVSFEKDGRRLVFHTDTYDHLHWNLHAVALGLEALRAVDRHGISSGSEQYAVFAQLTAGGPDPERGRILVEQEGGLTKALKRYHPDHGGAERDFIDVQAYRTVVEAR